MEKLNELAVWRQTCLNHYFELEVAAAHRNKAIKGAPIYLSLGQEHIPAIIANISRDFIVFPQHRGHSYYLSFGGDPAALVDELLGRPTGCSGGMGGSASWNSLANNLIGHSGLLGDQIPIAAGMALGSGKRTLVVMGDAAVEEDYALATFGFAATKKLPILFLCEDNDLSILTRKCVRRSWDVVSVARGFGLEAIGVSDNPYLVDHTVRMVLKKLPALVNINTHRHLWHAGSGNDGPPPVDRFQSFKKSLLRHSFELQITAIEEEAKLQMEQLWAQQLQKR